MSVARVKIEVDEFTSRNPKTASNHIDNSLNLAKVNKEAFRTNLVGMVMREDANTNESTEKDKLVSLLYLAALLLLCVERAGYPAYW
jgi:hypothetical protein